MSGLTRTPNSKVRRSARQNTYAGYKYRIESDAIMEHTKDSFVTAAQDLVDKKLWDAICGSAAVDKALQDLLAVPAKSELSYEPVAHLLNRISEAYVDHKYGKHTPPATGVLVTVSSHTVLTHGDYLGHCTKSDWHAFFDTRPTLDAVLKGRCILEPRVVSVLILIGEGKPTPATMRGQFKYYLSSLKQYRPDIHTVFGFQLEGNNLYMSSLNPCGMTISAHERGDLAAWVALVVRLYDCHENSDQRFVYRDSVDNLARWTVSLPGQEPFSVVPFHASRCPGRMTWAGFELPSAADQRRADFRRLAYRQPAAGFFKLSWQDHDSRFKEGELLDRAHKDGWLPGLVRHRFYHRYDDQVSMEVDGKKKIRQLEVLHLASLGEPLSKCRTPEHILSVMYDLLQTHLELFERGILHRDLSWFNVLIEPRHHPITNDKPDLVGIPCIEQIFGNPDGKPMALLTDLDHAALKDIIWAPGYSPRRERTGTAMFVARELSSEVTLEAPVKMKLKGLRERLEAIEKHGDIFKRAFPDSEANEDFMRRFLAVIERENTRYLDLDDDTSYNADELHRAHHDVESVYWIAQWCFARALPKDRIAFESGTLAADDFDKFCNNMLDHKVGQEQVRPGYLKTAPEGCAAFFHKDLQRFGPMFSAMATYLAIPWHIYLKDKTVKPDHAHHALRRIVLLEIVWLRNEGKTFNYELDTMQPRIFEGPPLVDRPTLPYIKSSSHVLTGSSSSQTGSKRKADECEPDASPDSAPSAKKAKGLTSERDPDSAVQRYNMFWNDIRLWFGTGQR